MLLTCGVVFFLVKYVPDRHAPQKCTEEVERLKKKLKRHSNLDRLVHQEYLFVENQKKNHSAFFQSNVKHLEAISDNLRDLIYRKRNLYQTLTMEYGSVKEQLMLMQKGDVKKIDYELAKENCEKLSQVLQQLMKITEQEKEGCLMWENIKQLRNEQFQFVNKIREEKLYAVMSETQNEKEGDGDEKEKQMVAWKK